jgi:tripartite-type tricarboxylate transporter receptor subunit TctC
MTRKFAIITVFLILAVISGMVSCTPKAETATPADFYKGKTIDLVTTGSAGSFNDLTANIIASYLGRDTGATVVVTNRSGSGGLEGMNYLYKAKPDGLTIGSVASVKFVQNKVLNEPAAAYEIDKFSYIMSVDRQPYYFFVSPEGPYQSVADLKAGKNLKIGGSSPSGPVSLGGLTIIKLLGLDAKVITGFDTDTDRALAVKRGEIVGYCLNIPNARANIEAGMVKPLCVLATERDPLAPDVPAITELVNLTGEDLALVKLWETAFVASNLFVASPGIPEDRLAFLRSLANKWVQEEEFREEIDHIATYSVSKYLTGDEVAKAMLDMASALEDFQAIFAELIEKYRA